MLRSRSHGRRIFLESERVEKTSTLVSLFSRIIHREGKYFASIGCRMENERHFSQDLDHS